jgi:N-acetylglucosamine kinase-like BadF-type ATPase
MNEPNKKRMIPLHLADQAVAACNKEIAELRAQVAELKQQPDPLIAYLYAAELAKDHIKKLKAENKRLRDAGDAMAARLLYQGYPETVQAWEAAKKL